MPARLARRSDERRRTAASSAPSWTNSGGRAAAPRRRPRQQQQGGAGQHRGAGRAARGEQGERARPAPTRRPPSAAHAGHAAEPARVHAAPNSTVGQLAAYRSAMQAATSRPRPRRSRASPTKGLRPDGCRRARSWAHGDPCRRRGRTARACARAARFPRPRRPPWSRPPHPSPRRPRCAPPNAAHASAALSHPPSASQSAYHPYHLPPPPSHPPPPSPPLHPPPPPLDHAHLPPSRLATALSHCPRAAAAWRAVRLATQGALMRLLNERASTVAGRRCLQNKQVSGCPCEKSFAPVSSGWAARWSDAAHTARLGPTTASSARSPMSSLRPSHALPDAMTSNRADAVFAGNWPAWLVG